MLNLYRRPGETITIGDDVTVTVLRVKGCQVRLAIQAPENVPVHREEIAERIRVDREIAERLREQPEPVFLKHQAD